MGQQTVDARWLLALATAVLCTALLASVQFSFDGLRDGDSYFHTRAARELDQQGIQRQFPQTVHSTWSERYSDKDLLFHVFLIPFQRFHGDAAEGDLVTPGKYATVVLNLLFFAALAYALRSAGARWPWLWVLLFFATNALVLVHLLAVRPDPLGIAFLLVEIALILRGRWLPLFVVAALHTLSHTSFIFLPILAVAAATACLARREPVPLRVLAATLAGPAVVSLVHPYFPNNLYLAWNQIVDVARSVWRADGPIPRDLFGAEYVSSGARHLLAGLRVLAPPAVGVVAVLARPRRRLSTAGLSLMLMSCVFLVLALLSQRFLAYLFPVVTLLSARLWTDLLGGATLREARRTRPAAVYSVLGLFLLCLVAGLPHSNVFRMRRDARSLITKEIHRPAVEYLKRTASPGDLVYHSFWWDFSALYHFRPDGRYVVALDPVFFYRHDAALFRKSLEAYRGRTEDLYGMLKRDFGARWIFLPKQPRNYPFFQLIRADDRFRRAYEDAATLVVRLPPPGSAKEDQSRPLSPAGTP